MFEDADADTGPASAPVIRAFDAGSPEPQAALRNSQKGIWERELRAGCRDLFLSRMKWGDALGGQGRGGFCGLAAGGTWAAGILAGLRGGVGEEPAHL